MTESKKNALVAASKSANKPNPGARPKGTKPTAPATKKSATKSATKTATKTSTKKDVAASSAAALATQATKDNASQTAQPGVIASIMSTLSDAKKEKVMLTVEEIVNRLAVIHPDRPVPGMTTTVRAQLSRLPHEKEFAIKSLRDGRRTRYCAA